MQASEIRQMSDGEILKAVEVGKEELFRLRFQLEIGQLENHSRLRVVKRDIARYKTVLRERQLAKELLREEENAE